MSVRSEHPALNIELPHHESLIVDDGWSLLTEHPALNIELSHHESLIVAEHPRLNIELPHLESLIVDNRFVEWMTGLHGRRSHVPASPPYWNLRNQWSCICYYCRWEIWTLKLYKNSWLCLIKSLRMFLASLLAIKQDLGIHSFAHSSLFHSSLFHSLLFTLCSSLFHSLLFALSLKITRLKERPCAIRSRHSLKRVTCWRAIRSCSLFKKSDVSYLGVFLSLFRAQNTNALLKTNLFFFTI